LVPSHFNPINFIKCLISARNNKKIQTRERKCQKLPHVLHKNFIKYVIDKETKRYRFKSHTQSWMLLSPEIHHSEAAKTKYKLISDIAGK
jgi:hypothetical protein